MKGSILLLLGLFLGLSAPSAAQHYSKHANYSCNNDNSTCFQTEVIKAEPSGACMNYEFKVSYEGKCDHALSHYTVAIPCGKVTNLKNSKGWKQEFGFDPTTGLTGFKIDDIPNFGETSLKSFIVKFTLCPDNSKCDNNRSCEEELECWSPVVAYKAGKQVDYDTLKNSCPNTNLAATLQHENVSCYGATNGSVTAVVTEGKEPFTYTWSTGDTTATISNLAAGTYSVTIKDAAGAQIDLTATITQPDAITAAGVITNASCNGKPDGAINLSATGGNGGYTYLWSNGATTEDITGLKAGSYSVTVKDSIGCTTQKAFTLTNTTQITVSGTSVLPACNQANGSIDITATGGTAPYTFLWSNGATTEDLQNLAAGLYKVVVTDANGCTTEFAYNLRDNNTLKLSAAVTQTTCTDDASGAVDVTVTGGTPPYVYNWSTGATTEDLIGLTTGLYKLTVTDANGCLQVIQVTISKKTFQVSAQITQPKCNGDSNGSIVLSPSGGVEPYTYEWSNGASGNSQTRLGSGIYYVTVIDAAGCEKNLTYVLSNPPVLVASAVVSNTQCSTEGSSSIDLTVTGGKAPYTYAWSNGATTEDLNSLQSGTYTVVITDANGCSITKEVIVTASTTGFFCLINQPDTIPVCNSSNNILTTSVDDGSYQWSVQSSDGQWAITGSTTGQSISYTAGSTNSSATFTLTITKDGCSQTCTYTATTCTSDDGGNGGGDGDDDETCEECFDSSIKLISADGSCKTYEVIVNTTGNCKHELSHWDIAIPCGNITNTWNSQGWAMEIGKDPTTGLHGLKVDNIDDFGKEPETFKVKFTVCGDKSCEETLHTWNPIVAYKAGQCIAYDTLNLSGGDDNDHDEDDGKICAYPNPFHGKLKFTWECDADDYVELDIIDKCGKEVNKVYKGKVTKGESYSFECDGENLNEDIYIYRFTSTKKKPQYGKLIRRH